MEQNGRAGEVEVCYEPMTDESRAKVQSIIDALERVGEAIGGWSAKSDNRQTGVSYHAKFEKKVDVYTTVEFTEQLSQSPPLLVNACYRLLAADDEIRRLRG